MFKILNQPYPQRERTLLQSVLHSAAEGLFVFLFFALFQPFGMSEWKDPNKYFYLMGFGLITALVSLFIKALLPVIFPKFHQEENWVVWKEIFNILLILTLITCGVIVYSSYLFHWQVNFAAFFQMFLWVAIIGIFPTSFWVMYDYIDKLKKYSKPIQVIHHDVQQEASKTIEFIADNEKDKLTIAYENLFFIESTDNYSTIYFLKNAVLQKEMIRSSLSRLEGQIKHNLVVRCHRSFIVNLEKVENITGNAQGYKLQLNRHGFIIPVARKYSSIIEKIR